MGDMRGGQLSPPPGGQAPLPICHPKKIRDGAGRHSGDDWAHTTEAPAALNGHQACQGHGHYGGDGTTMGWCSLFLDMYMHMMPAYQQYLA